MLLCNESYLNCISRSVYIDESDEGVEDNEDEDEEDANNEEEEDEEERNDREVTSRPRRSGVG